MREPSVHVFPSVARGLKVLYGAGQIADSIKTVLFGLFLLFFYTTVMGLPAFLVGIIAAGGLVWDALIDPYIGHLSDVTRSRLGRRHGFMIAGAVLMGPSFWALFSPPQGLSTGLLLVWALVTSLLVRTATSLFTVPYLALGAEMSQDYDERNTISGVRAACALTGTLAAAGLSFVLFFPNDATGADNKLSYTGYPMMGLTFGFAMTLFALVATVSTLRWRRYIRVSDNAMGASLTTRTFFASVAASFKNSSFRAVFASFSLFFLAVVVNAILTIYFLTYYVEITDSGALSLLQVGFYGGAVMGTLVWLKVARGVEKRWLYLAATVVTSVAMAGAVLLFGQGHPLGVGDARLLLAGFTFVGFFASILWVMPASMIADVVDEDELATGRRREGVFYGIFSFGQQMAAGLALVITGVFVDAYAGLIAGESTQSALTVQRVAVLYGLLPAVLLGLAAILILRYPLDRRRVKAIQLELSRRRMTASATGGDKTAISPPV